MIPGLTALEAEITRELPMAAPYFGVLAFIILLILLLVTLAIGKGRPHS